MPKAKTIGIIGIKGGVGKTSITANLGVALAQALNKKTLLIDANFSTPHLAYHLGLLDPKTTLQGVLSNEVHISKALYKHKAGFHLLPGALSKKSLDVTKLKKLISSIKHHYDYIIIDSSPSLNEEIFSTIDAADELLLVTSPDYPTLSSTFHALKIAKDKKAPVRGLVINKTRSKKFELKKQDIEKATNTKVLAVIPDDLSVLEALSLSKPVMIHSPKSPASVEFKKLAVLLSEGTKK